MKTDWQNRKIISIWDLVNGENQSMVTQFLIRKYKNKTINFTIDVLSKETGLSPSRILPFLMKLCFHDFLETNKVKNFFTIKKIYNEEV